MFLYQATDVEYISRGLRPMCVYERGKTKSNIKKKRKQISQAAAAAVFWFFFCGFVTPVLLIRMRATLRANIKEKMPTQSILLLLFLSLNVLL